MKIKALEIDDLPPGSVVRLPNFKNDWVRMVDAPAMHFNGGLFCPTTGEWYDWQSLCWIGDEVELIKTNNEEEE